MNYIGEYTQNSTILLELLTYDELNNPINADFPPTAKIEFFHDDGVIVAGHATLRIVDLGRYYGLFHIPETFLEGNYTITYEAVLDGQTYSTKERFRVSGIMEMLHENLHKIEAVQSDIGNPSADRTTLYQMLIELVGQHKDTTPSLVSISDKTILTDSGGYTTVIVSGRPVRGATVKIYNAESPYSFVTKAITDEKGGWKAVVYKGKYKFEFIHPDGQILRSIERTVH